MFSNCISNYLALEQISLLFYSETNSELSKENLICSFFSRVKGSLRRLLKMYLLQAEKLIVLIYEILILVFHNFKNIQLTYSYKHIYISKWYVLVIL